LAGYFFMRRRISTRRSQNRREFHIATGVERDTNLCQAFLTHQHSAADAISDVSEYVLGSLG
jgi:hypothetical protein